MGRLCRAGIAPDHAGFAVVGRRGTPFKWTERRAAREILQNRPRWETLIESILRFVYNEGKTGTE